MKRRRFRWRTKMFAMLLVFATIPVMVLAFMSIRAVRAQSEGTTYELLVGIARAKAEGLERMMGQKAHSVERIATLLGEEMGSLDEAPVPVEELPTLIDGGDEEGEGGDDEESGDPTPDEPSPDGPAPEGPAEEEGEEEPLSDEPTVVPVRHPDLSQTSARLRRTLALVLWDQTEFEELLVIDAEGVVRASTFVEHEGTSARELEYFTRGLAATFVQPLFQSPITDELTMVIATPIRDDDDGTTLGVLAARLNLSLLFTLLEDHTGLGRTGETVVGRRLGDEVVFMSATRFDPDAALTRRVATGDPLAAPVQEAAGGGAGQGEAEDYRGHEVYAVWQHVESLGWGLVVKMDVEEADETSTELTAQTLVLLVAVMVLVFAASAFFSGPLVRPLRRLERAADKVSKGELEVDLEIPPGDEIGDLAESFERMVAAIRFFRAQAQGVDEDDYDTGGSEPPPEAAPETAEPEEQA